jgi:hypothetical protein
MQYVVVAGAISVKDGFLADEMGAGSKLTNSIGGK